MKLSVSNLAWPVEETNWCLEQLIKHNIKGVELAPLKVFSSWDSISDDEITSVKEKYNGLGLQISSFQAITFGADDLALLGDKTKVSNFLLHMVKVASLLSKLGGENAVFGSPGLRKQTGYNEQELADLFIEIDSIFSTYNVNFALETVPSYYGCNLLNTFEKTNDLLTNLNLSNVCRHFDSGCQYLSHDLEDVESCLDFISQSKHVHISEVDLNNFVNVSQYNIDIAAKIKKYYQGHWCVLEMSDKGFSRDKFISSINNFVKLFGIK